MATKKGQRIAIWVIAIVMTVGTLGAYFIAILEMNNNKRLQEEQTNAMTESLTEDPTAYKVDGDVTELEVVDLTVGDGDAVKEGDTIKFHYKGTIAQSGLKFDSSYDRGEPITYPLADLIVGWQEGLIGMKEGGKRRLVIPSEKGYGDQEGVIPANSDLVFEIELIEVNPAE